MMTRYYNNDDKITFDEASSFVERYIRMNRERRNRVSSQQIAKAYDIEPCQHNLIRLNDELKNRLEIDRKRSSKSTLYKIESDSEE